MSLGSRLRDARLKLGFSQEYVAKRLDLHRTTIGNMKMMQVCRPQIY